MTSRWKSSDSFRQTEPGAGRWDLTDATRPASSKVPHLTISAGPFAGVAFGNQGHRTSNDTSVGSSKSVIGGVRVSPRWRVLNDTFGLGFSASMAWLESHELSSTRWYDGQLAGRYYLGQARESQPWLDATIGNNLQFIVSGLCSGHGSCHP
jgi:hypothetical protein